MRLGYDRNPDVREVQRYLCSACVRARARGPHDAPRR